MVISKEKSIRKTKTCSSGCLESLWYLLVITVVLDLTCCHLNISSLVENISFITDVSYFLRISVNKIFNFSMVRFMIKTK